MLKWHYYVHLNGETIESLFNLFFSPRILFSFAGDLWHTQWGLNIGFDVMSFLTMTRMTARFDGYFYLFLVSIHYYISNA